MANTAIHRPLRLAFVGGHGHHYLRHLLRDSSITIEAVAVASDGHDVEATRHRFRDQIAVGTWYDDVETMLDDFRPTVVNVGGVYARNARAIIAALRRHVPVIADKPIAGTWEELSAIRDAAAASNAPLITEFDMRCRPCFRAAADAVAHGDLGKVALASAQKSYRFGERRPDFYRRREDYGSTLLWIGSHAIDAIRFATATPFEHVTGLHGNVTRPDYAPMEDHAVALFSLVGGAAAIVHADYLRPDAAATHGDDRLRIAGSRGVVELRDNRCWLTTHDQPEREITERFAPLSPARAMLAAAIAGDDALFSTAHSLELATILLTARDAADGCTRLPIPPTA
jgi:predicted dehydrogenase